MSANCEAINVSAQACTFRQQVLICCIAVGWITQYGFGILWILAKFIMYALMLSAVGWRC